MLAAIGNQTATVGQTLTFTASATDPDAGQTRTFTLVTPPAGASINTTTGAFSWTPSAAGSFTVTVRVTDNGSPVLFDEEVITVTVSATPPANQAPVLATIGNRTATVGQALAFTASATDPNAGQTLTYSLVTPPAGAIINASTGAFSWTPTAAGTFGFTVRVADNGSPALADEEAITVTVSSPPPAGSFVFYRAVNLGGAALTLDGNAWAASTAANYTTNGTPFVDNAVALVPATDAIRTGLIRDALYGPGLSAGFTAVPAGAYRAYLWVWEDNNAEVYSLALNGQTVLTNASSGPAGTWARLGPYPLTLAATGAITFVSSGGWQNFSGIELWQQAGAARATATAVSPAVTAKESAARAYPNPSPDGRFTVALPKSLHGDIGYKLVSALGATVSEGKLNGTPQNASLKLDFSRQIQAAGVYYLHLTGPQGQAHLRLLRE